MVGGGACGGGASYETISMGFRDVQNYVYDAFGVASCIEEEIASRDKIYKDLQENAQLVPSECQGQSGPSSALCLRSSRFRAPTRRRPHGRLAHRLFLLCRTSYLSCCVQLATFKLNMSKQNVRELWSRKFFGSSSRGLPGWGPANEPHLHHPAKAYLNVKPAVL
jgi:hypothetical protein